MRLGPYTPGTAVTVGGPLAISGNPTIAGANGGVHANGNLSLSGNPTISSNATASGTYSASGNPAIGGIAAGGQPLVTIPTINPAQFFDSRDFRLASDGNVYNKDGVVQPKSGGKWNGWDYSSGKWSLSGNTTINATLYIEGDAVISGNIGSTANPWVTTIIATKSIEVSGNPKMRPPTTTDAGSLYRSGTENLLLVAGGDVKISGNPNQSYQGIIAAHEQLSLSGNPTLNGFIVVENAANSGGSYADNNTISGNIGITYNGSLDNPFPGDVQVMTWQLGS